MSQIFQLSELTIDITVLICSSGTKCHMLPYKFSVWVMFPPIKKRDEIFFLLSYSMHFLLTNIQFLPFLPAPKCITFEDDIQAQHKFFWVYKHNLKPGT